MLNTHNFKKHNIFVNIHKINCKDNLFKNGQKYLNIQVFKLQLTHDVLIYPEKEPHLCSIAPCKIYYFNNTTHVALKIIV